MLDESQKNIILFEIFEENPAISRSEKAVSELLSTCKTQEELDLIRHTLRITKYLSDDELHAIIEKSTDYISNLVKDGNSIAVVAMAYDGSADSSQAIIHLFKTYLPDSDDIILHNSIPAFIRSLRNKSDYNQCIIVDEFTGTGSTVINRYNYLTKNTEKLSDECEFSFLLLVGMENAITNIKSEGIDVEVFMTNKAGISGYFPDKEAGDRIALMKRLESELAAKIGEEALPSLGVGSAEAAYSIKNWNAPNSNFPILWWPKLKDESVRKTLFKRRGF